MADLGEESKTEEVEVEVPLDVALMIDGEESASEEIKVDVPPHPREAAWNFMMRTRVRGVFNEVHLCIDLFLVMSHPCGLIMHGLPDVVFFLPT